MSTEKRYIELFTNPGMVSLREIPVLEYHDFSAFVDLLMGEEGTHVVMYFAVPVQDKYKFICCMAADENHALILFSHEQPGLSVPAITARHFQFHVFEREIHERYGISFEGHPWLKPGRYAHDRADRLTGMDQYPFFSIGSPELHEVGVGPIHAGIIEPGYFRFICQGEKVLHLEIQLGYQHRGVERLMVEKKGTLQRAILSENIAGDTTVGHSLAHAAIIESLAGIDHNGPAGVQNFEPLQYERTIALEMERIAVHIGDTAALCNDVAYQYGQVMNENLRTIVINTMQLWCGNRFGKGLIRPGGTHYPLTPALTETILANLDQVNKEYARITRRIFSLPSVLGRFEGTGRLTTMQASLAGAVGMTARSSGMYRDIRWSHPFAAFTEHAYEPVMLPGGDVWSRAMLRRMEVERSIAVIRRMTSDKGQMTSDEYVTRHASRVAPNYDLALAPGALAISLVEGWRGEICHAAITGMDGKIAYYKVKDPSFHNWMALALAVRNQEISDFPLCNKSFNLSYCGNDL
jgi:Ni,Fe-hydrogenase III large subunit